MIKCENEDCIYNEYQECLCQTIEIDETGKCQTFAVDFDHSEEKIQNRRDGYHDEK